MHTVVINPNTGESRTWEKLGTSTVTFPFVGDVSREGSGTLTTWISGNNCDGWDVTMKGNAVNGYGGPGITYEIKLHVTPEGKVMGSIVRDPYPAYEIWLYTGPANNATPVFQGYPANGQTVIGLATPLGP